MIFNQFLLFGFVIRSYLFNLWYQFRLKPFTLNLIVLLKINLIQSDIIIIVFQINMDYNY
jgi:hypothetical protein